jgi:hypothetical protein
MTIFNSARCNDQCDAAYWLGVVMAPVRRGSRFLPHFLLCEVAGSERIEVDARNIEITCTLSRSTFPVGANQFGYRFADGSTLLQTGAAQWLVIPEVRVP